MKLVFLMATAWSMCHSHGCVMGNNGITCMAIPPTDHMIFNVTPKIDRLNYGISVFFQLVFVCRRLPLKFR